MNPKLPLALLAAAALLPACSSNEQCLRQHGFPLRDASAPTTGARGVWQPATRGPLPYLAWLPRQAARPRAVVIASPGWDSVASEFETVGRHLAPRGYAVYALNRRHQDHDPDVRGRGDSSDWREWPRDLTEFSAHLARRHPGAPIFLMGQSMGTIHSLSALTEGARPRGLVLCGLAIPALDPHIPAHIDFGGRVAFALAPKQRYPHLCFTLKEEIHLSDDPDFDRAWLTAGRDRVEEGYTLGFSREALAMGRAALAALEQAPLPMLVLLGDSDDFQKTTESGAYGRFIEDHLSGRTNIALRLYPSGEHIPFVGGTRRRALADISAWLDRQTRRD